MKRKLFFALFLCFALIWAGCSDRIILPEKMPKDFQFSIRYGIGANDAVNTFEGTITKDLVLRGTVTIPQKLEKEELQSIYKEMREINIMEYENPFTPPYKKLSLPTEKVEVTPYKTYVIKIQADGKEKEIYWEDRNESQTSSAVELRGVIKKIDALIKNKEAYKKLPKPEGGYD